MNEDFRALLEGMLQRCWSAEMQILDALPLLAEAATLPRLRATLEGQMTEAECQAGRLRRAAALLEMDTEGVDCEAMEGLLAEAEEIQDQYEPGPIRDAALLGAARRMAHHQIAAYATLCALSHAAGLEAVAALLGHSLAEERAADEELGRVAAEEVNPAALHAAG